MFDVVNLIIIGQTIKRWSSNAFIICPFYFFCGRELCIICIALYNCLKAITLIFTVSAPCIRSYLRTFRAIKLPTCSTHTVD